MLSDIALVKSYLRVDSSDEDEFITQLMETAKTLVCDVSRKTEKELEEYGKVVDTAELFVIAYLYEHREEADHKQLVNTVKHLLFSVRKEAF
uniref:head-tail connector protein n=1 Tax=Acetatifactor sp. TaxID=1872090 RepID=UPI0040574606